MKQREPPQSLSTASRSSRISRRREGRCGRARGRPRGSQRPNRPAPRPRGRARSHRSGPGGGLWCLAAKRLGVQGRTGAAIADTDSRTTARQDSARPRVELGAANVAREEEPAPPSWPKRAAGWLPLSQPARPVSEHRRSRSLAGGSLARPRRAAEVVTRRRSHAPSRRRTGAGSTAPTGATCPPPRSGGRGSPGPPPWRAR